jgi:thiamine biosynthesis lipoprotein
VTHAENLTHVRPRMGTLLAVTMPRRRDPEAEARYLSTVFDTAAACEQVMSRHRADSAVRQLNERAGCPRGVASPELARALSLARRLSQATEGAFDPTVGPVLDVWHQASRRGAWPCRRRLHAARAAVGWQAIRVSEPRVALLRAGMAIDLGGFGKGAALDLIAARLKQHRCGAALLNFGESSLVAIGQPPGGRWRIVLRHPRGGFVGEFPLDRACSTSATFGHTMRIGSEHVSHIVDPRTARPVRWSAQVTVLTRSAAVAEAVSTALLVRGRSAFDEVAHHLKVDACWIDDAGIATTPWFPLRRLMAVS